MALKTVAIVGGSGGIGSALIATLAARDDISVIHATRRREPGPTPSRDSDQAASIGEATTDPEGAGVEASADAIAGKVRWAILDVTDEPAVASWVKSLGSIDWLINCVGMLHDDAGQPEKSIRSLDPEHFQRSMQINCLPTLLLGKYVLPALRRSPQAVFATVSARVGSIADNRLGGWYSYRSSKAALNMSLKCLAIEWARSAKSIRVAALHPGTTDTALSVPFQRNVPEGKLFSAEKTAKLLIEQIDCLHDHPSGRFIAYDGEEIPW